MILYPVKVIKGRILDLEMRTIGRMTGWDIDSVDQDKER